MIKYWQLEFDFVMGPIYKFCDYTSKKLSIFEEHMNSWIRVRILQISIKFDKIVLKNTRLLCFILVVGDTLPHLEALFYIFFIRKFFVDQEYLDIFAKLYLLNVFMASKILARNVYVLYKNQSFCFYPPPFSAIIECFNLNWKIFYQNYFPLTKNNLCNCVQLQRET